MNSYTDFLKKLLPENHEDKIQAIHKRVEEELGVTEKKIIKLNKYLRSEEVARLLIETLKKQEKEENASKLS